MLTHLRILLSVASIFMLAQFGVANEHSADASISKYATDDFFAACRVDPNRLINSPVFNAIPMEAALSLGRFKTIPVAEFVVFAGPAANQKNGRRKEQAARLELAAAARFSQPVEFDSLLKQWRRSTVPSQSASATKPEVIRIGRHKCFRMPAGTFLNSRRIYGKLRFTDRQGRPSKGIDVGDEFRLRGYFEGGTKASAVFTLNQVNETDLIDSCLPLEMRIKEFRVVRRENEFSRVQLLLKNPENNLYSEPFSFEVKSYVNQRLAIPRRLNAIDGSGETRQVDLLKNFVSDGKLDVVLRGYDRHVYFGVGEHDLNLATSAAEYVYVADREIVVVQSPETLKKMLLAAEKPGLLANRLSTANNLTIVANVREESRRKALWKMIGEVVGESVSGWGETVTGFDASINMSKPVIAGMKLDLSNPGSAARLKREVERALQSLKQAAYGQIDQFANHVDPGGSLLTLAFNGAPMSFPKSGVPPTMARQRLRVVADEVLAGVKVESTDAALIVEVNQPKVFSHWPPLGQFALAWWEEKRAKTWFAKEKFDLGAAMYRRATARLPNSPEIWFRRAHHLSYNISVKFDGYESRYAWVRRGIEALLDGAEQNANSPDLIWMAARFIARKIGDSDERVQYRRQFSEDRRLHGRLASFIEIDKARSPAKRIDNWLAAKMMFQYCIRQKAKSGAPLPIPPILFFSQPAAAQASYAQSLDQEGHGDSAKAWAEAERLYNELGARKIKFDMSGEIRLGDYQKRLADFGPKDARVKLIQKARHWIQYDYWLVRCRLEQADKVRAARKLAREADQQFRKANLRKSLELYRRSLQTLAEQMHQESKTRQLAEDFFSIASGYRRVAKLLDEQTDESVKSILELIENALPRSRFPLLDQELMDIHQPK